MQESHASTGATTALPTQMSETVLRTYDLTKQYDARRAVNQLNFEIDQRITGDGAMRCCFDNSFLNRRPKLLRH